MLHAGDIPRQDAKQIASLLDDYYYYFQGVPVCIRADLLVCSFHSKSKFNLAITIV